MKKTVSIAFLVAALAAFAWAQHGTAQAGDFDPNFGADTWTGNVAALDPATFTLTLSSPTGEKFSGTLHKPLTVVDANGNPIHGGQLGEGDKVTVYYVPKGQQYTVAPAAPSDPKGKPEKTKKETASDNYIYKIKLLGSTQGTPQAPAPPK